MIRSVLVLAALFAGLLVWDRSLGERIDAERQAEGRLRPLIDEATRDSFVVAAVRVETAAGESFLYARAGGVWRLVEPPVLTYADDRALAGLMQAVVDSEGVVLTDEKLRAKSYGFGGDLAVRLTFHGTQLRTAEDGDVLYAVDLGFPIEGTSGAYVRPLGTHEVWAIDQNPRQFLTRPPGSSFPPMLDPNLMPNAFVSAIGGGFDKIERRDRTGGGWTLERTPPPPGSPPDAGPGEWTITYPNGTTEAADTIPATGYSLFLLRSPYDGVVGAANLATDLPDSPAVRLVLHPTAGEPFELLVSASDARGGRQVLNLGTGTAFQLSQEIAELLLPDAETVSDVDLGNPWHDWIQVNPMAGVNPLLNPIRTR